MARELLQGEKGSVNVEGMIDIREMTVGIVDDIETMCKSIRGMLKVLGYGRTYLYAHNGSEALKMLLDHSVDLLIMDWNMPVMSGLEALYRIREEETTRDLPVIMVTAEANREMVAEAAESDIDAYLLKPLTVKSLGDKIFSVVQKVNDPPLMFVHLKKARAHKEEGNTSLALTEIKAALKADPSSSKPLREMGILYFETGNLENAEKWLRKASAMNKYDVVACHYLGELYLTTNHIDRAVKYFDKAMQISPRHVGRGIHFGKTLLQKGLQTRAGKVFEKAIDLSRGNTALMEEVAVFCMENGAHALSVHWFESVLKKQPTRVDLLLHIGVIFEKTDDPMKAIDTFSRILKTDPDHQEALLHLAKNYVAVDQVLRAEKMVKRVLDLDAENPDARELMRRLI